MTIKDKVAIVTGASAGLGLATVEALISKGATVYGLARSAEKLAFIEKRLGVHFKPVILDVCNTQDITNWVKSTFNATHFPHILVNNAGVSKFSAVEDLLISEWNSMIDTNLTAVHTITAAVVPFMKRDESSSHIINIGSILGTVSGSMKSAYSATKFAIQGYSEALFKELRGYNIKVSCFNPGSIMTHFFESSGISPDTQMLLPEELADIMVFLLETPENVLIDNLTVRPLRPSR